MLAATDADRHPLVTFRDVSVSTKHLSVERFDRLSEYYLLVARVSSGQHHQTEVEELADTPLRGCPIAQSFVQAFPILLDRMTIQIGIETDATSNMLQKCATKESLQL